MPIQVEIPALGDSVSEAILTKWLKNDGDYVKDAEPIAELETDKANVDLPAPASGVLKRAVAAGTTVKIKQVVASIDESATPTGGAVAATVAEAASGNGEAATSASAASAGTSGGGASKPGPRTLDDLSPAVRRVVAEANLDPAKLVGTGPGGRVTKEDAVAAATSAGASAAPAGATAAPAGASAAPAGGLTAAPPRVVRTPPPPPAPSAPAGSGGVAGPAGSPSAGGWGIQTGDSVPFGPDGRKRVPMSKIRKKIAERLVAAQHTAAILHTYNEVDLTEVINLRTKYKESFEKQHGVGLGFMSFFVRAVCQALKAFPRVNAQIDGDDIVYHDYVHMGIAVSTERGLVVPVLRNAHAMSFATIESEIKRLAQAARDGKLAMDEMSGGTFSITNGGVFGSLLSAPILNPPQSGILGMHAIQKRPVVVNDEIKIRSMMYIVLGYDHRIIDGRDSVSFLVRVKQLLEDPARLMLDV
ncbi:MAG: 2-oxoglutarate dehydrogenase complex dihydrolipoyllysine-residue succinyltransferase [Tepidisphaerales bacterium]